jgi:hypothetical protein
MQKLPAWLQRPPPQDCPRKREKYRRTIRYFTAMHDGAPPWLSTWQVAWYRAIYRRMRYLRSCGHDVAVDHIVPLRHPYVCGLCVPWNLKIVTAAENNAKSNKWWPDTPDEQLSLF